MCSCGNVNKPVVNGPKLLEELRDLKGLKLDIKLNDYKLSFDEVIGDWKSILIYNLC
jgi:hypothetical protein